MPAATKRKRPAKDGAEGYVVKRDTVKMWLPAPYAGAFVVVATELTLGDYGSRNKMAVTAAKMPSREDIEKMDLDDDSPEAEAKALELMETVNESIKMVADWGDEIIVEWNLLNEDKKPKPCTGAEFLKLPSDLRSAITRTWREDVQKVPAPLDSPSKNGNGSKGVTKKTARRSRRRRSS